MNPLAPIITVGGSLLLVWLAMALNSSLLFQLYLGITSIFLVLLVLVQKGRGGGLAGALGGPGGSSAFGAKAGDVFTRITILAAVVWVIFAIGAASWASRTGDAFGTGGGQLGRPPASGGTQTPSGEGNSFPASTPPGSTSPDAPETGPDLGAANGSDSTPATETPAAETPAAEVPATEAPAVPPPESPMPSVPPSDSQP